MNNQTDRSTTAKCCTGSTYILASLTVSYFLTRLHLISQEMSISAINSYGSWTVLMVPSEMGLYNPEVKICCA